MMQTIGGRKFRVLNLSYRAALSLYAVREHGVIIRRESRFDPN